MAPVSTQEVAELVRRFVDEAGHGRVPGKAVIDGVSVGEIVAEARFRHRRGRLDADDVAVLTAAGLQWTVRPEEKSEDQFAALDWYRQEHGNVAVPPRYLTPLGWSLGQWLSRMESLWRDGDLPDAQVERLRALGVSPWERKKTHAQWHRRCDAYERYVAEHGSASIPGEYVTADGINLGRWVSRMRTQRRNGELTDAQIHDLESVGFRWETDGELRWLRSFAKYEEWARQTGQTAPGQKDHTRYGWAVGAWWRRQMDQWAAGTLPAERTAKLASVGADPHHSRSLTGRWDRNMRRLRDFIREHGHAEVPSNYVSSDGFALGQWFFVQQRKHTDGTLAPDRRAQLQDVGVRLGRRRPAGRARPRGWQAPPRLDELVDLISDAEHLRDVSEVQGIAG